MYVCMYVAACTPNELPYNFPEQIKEFGIIVCINRRAFTREDV